MKFENLKFNQATTSRVYLDYMKRVAKVTRSLSAYQREDVHMEITSHIYEAMQQKTEVDETNHLLDVLERLGAPEEILKPLVADRKLELATKTFNPVHVFSAMVLNFTNGIAYVIFALLYLFLFSFVFLAGAKIFYPDQIGLFYFSPTHWTLGFMEDGYKAGSAELLGNWFIPAMMLAMLFFYLLITLMLKFIRSVRKTKVLLNKNLSEKTRVQVRMI